MWPNKWNVNQCTCWKGTLLFLPSGCFILAIKVTNFKNQISVQNCLDWLGKERKKKKKNLYSRATYKKHLLKYLTTYTINWSTQHYAYGSSILIGSKVWEEIHKHIFKSTSSFKRFILYFCTGLILLQEFIVRRYNLDSILFF